MASEPGVGETTDLLVVFSPSDPLEVVLLQGAFFFFGLTGGQVESRRFWQGLAPLQLSMNLPPLLTEVTVLGFAEGGEGIDLMGV